mgnify:CR=1 FL=1
MKIIRPSQGNALSTLAARASEREVALESDWPPALFTHPYAREMKREFCYFDDFTKYLAVTNGVVTCDRTWTNERSSGGVIQQSYAGHPGILNQTAANVNNRSSLTLGSGSIGALLAVGGYDEIDLEGLLRNPFTLDGVDIWTTFFGLSSSGSPSIWGSYYAVGFALNYTNTGVNWLCYAKDGATDNSQSSGVEAVATNWMKLRLTLDATNFKWYIDGNLVRTLSRTASGIPLTQNVKPMFGVMKTLGSTTRSTMIDYIFFKARLGRA